MIFTNNSDLLKEKCASCDKTFQISDLQKIKTPDGVEFLFCNNSDCQAEKELVLYG